MKKFTTFLAVLAILALALPAHARNHGQRGFYGSEVDRALTNNGCMVSGLLNVPDWRCPSSPYGYNPYQWTPYGVTNSYGNGYGYPYYPVYERGRWQEQSLSPVAMGIGGAILGAVIVHAIDKNHDGTYHKVRNGQASVQITNAPEPTSPPPALHHVQKICNKSPYSVKIFSDDTFIGTLPPNMEADRPTGHVELESTSISCDLAFPKVDGNIHVICQ